MLTSMETLDTVQPSIKIRYRIKTDYKYSYLCANFEIYPFNLKIRGEILFFYATIFVMSKKVNTLLTILLVITTVFFIISSSLVIPITCRSFYINQIDGIGAVEELNYATMTVMHTPATKQDVIDAFNSVMDFIWKGIPFKPDPNNPGGFLAGSLPLSGSAEQHFRDCIFLFWLDLIVFIITSLIMVTLLVLRIKNIFIPRKIFKMSPLLLGGAIVLLLLITFLILAATMGFYDFFVFLHYILFPGKDNFYFYWDEDLVVNILNEGFWMNACIFVGSVFAGQILVTVFYSVAQKIIEKKKQKKMAAN